MRSEVSGQAVEEGDREGDMGTMGNGWGGYGYDGGTEGSNISVVNERWGGRKFGNRTGSVGFAGRGKQHR